MQPSRLTQSRQVLCWRPEVCCFVWHAERACPALPPMHASGPRSMRVSYHGPPSTALYLMESQSSAHIRLEQGRLQSWLLTHRHSPNSYRNS